MAASSFALTRLRVVVLAAGASPEAAGAKASAPSGAEAAREARVRGARVAAAAGALAEADVLGAADAPERAEVIAVTRSPLRIFDVPAIPRPPATFCRSASLRLVSDPPLVAEVELVSVTRFLTPTWMRRTRRGEAAVLKSRGAASAGWDQDSVVGSDVP